MFALLLTKFRFKSPEFAALLDSLRTRYEERRYEILLGCVARIPNPRRNDWDDVKLVQKEIGLIVNILFSVIGCFFALLFLSQYILADLGQVLSRKCSIIMIILTLSYFLY